MSDLVVASLPLSHSLYLSLSVSFCLCFCLLSSSLSLALWYVFWEPRSCFSVSLSPPPPLARLTKNSTVRIKKRTGWRILHDHVETLDLVSNYTQNLVLVLFAPSLPPPIYRILSILPSLSFSFLWHASEHPSLVRLMQYVVYYVHGAHTDWFCCW